MRGVNPASVMSSGSFTSSSSENKRERDLGTAASCTRRSDAKRVKRSTNRARSDPPAAARHGRVAMPGCNDPEFAATDAQNIRNTYRESSSNLYAARLESVKSRSYDRILSPFAADIEFDKVVERRRR